MEEPHLELIFGPMFSGKTTELIRRIRIYKAADRKVVVVKYMQDTRYDDPSDEDANVSTHDQSNKHRAITSDKHLTLVLADLKAADVIGIDEGQFYADIVEVVNELLRAGKIVIISALDATFQKQPFGRVFELIPAALNVEKLVAVCIGCKRHNASFSILRRQTRRDDVLDPKTVIERIGGADKFEAVCLQCREKKLIENESLPPLVSVVREKTLMEF